MNIQSYLTWLPPGFGSSIATSPDRFQSLQLASWAFAPFAYLNGKLTSPFKSSERSAAQFGANGEFEFLGGQPFSLLVASVEPYYQTDFRGYGKIYGLEAYLEPYQPDWRLGTHVVTGAPVLIDPYWRVIAEINPVHVDKTGLSNFVKRDYDFVGATAQARAVLFENMTSVPTELCGRISLLGSYQYFWDTTRREPVHNAHAEIDYDLSGKTTAARYCSGSATPAPPSASPLQASLALTYDQGVDKSTLVKAQQLGVTLTVQY